MPTTGHSHVAPADNTPGSAATSTAVAGIAVAGRAGTAGAEPERQDTTIELAELICADPQWLHREFAELIAANYPPAAATPTRTGPPGRPSVATTHPPWPTRDRPGGPHSPRPGCRTRRGRTPVPVDGPARQRSPPSSHTRRRRQVDEPRPG